MAFSCKGRSPCPSCIAKRSALTAAHLCDADEDGEQARHGYSVLLARVFKQDLGDCEKCGGKMRLVACIEHPPTVHRILSHLGLPTEPPKKAPARAPPQLSFAGWDHSPDDDVADQLLN